MISWKEEDIMSINIDELKKKLKRNPVFNMSLSGKEIFHSNVLAWLLLETDDNDEATSTAKALTKLFPPKGLKADEKAEEKYRVLTVFREKNDFDLLIVYYLSEDKKQDTESMRDSIIAVIEDEDDEKKNHFENDSNKNNKQSPVEGFINNCKFVVIENKFKAIPDASQLDRYYLNVCGWKINKKTKQWQNGKFIDLGKIAGKKIQLNSENTTCYLLAPEKAKELFAQDSNTYSHDNKETGSQITVLWNLVTYEKVNEVIHKNMNTNYEPILEKYYEFTDLMLKLSEDAVAVNENTKIYDFEKTVKQLKSIRIHDFYEKLWFSAVMSIIRNDLLREIKEGLITDVGYSNGMGMLNFMYDFEQYSEARFGIEIQAKQFRIAVYITNKKQYKWKTEEGTTDKDPEKNQYPKIFYWLKSIYKQIKQDNKEHFDYPDEKELELKKFADFKYIKIPIKEQNLTIEVLGKKIKEVLSIMKSNEKNFEGKTERT